MNRQTNVTYIDDLPDLDVLTDFPPPPQLEKNNPNMSIGDPQDKYKKYIRNGNMKPYSESGMSLSRNHSVKHNMQQQSPPPQMPTEDDMFMYPAHNMYSAPNCIDVANHIKMCPICSKLYNTDYTMYVLCIIILAIVCIILMKKCLNI